MGSDDRSDAPGGASADASGTGTDATAERTDDTTLAVSVTVYSRDHCHLCHEAVETIEEAASAVDVPVTVEEVDVDADPQLREEYGDRVPYVLVAGRPAFKYRVDPDEAQRTLRAAVE